MVDVIGIWVAQQSLSLLLLRGELRHWLCGQVNGAGDPVERQIQLIEFFACALKAELDSALFPLRVASDLVQRLVQVNDLCCHLLGKPFNTHDPENDQNQRCQHYNHRYFVKDIFH